MMKTLLSAYLTNKELAQITDEKIPTFKRLEFSISGLEHELILVDSKNRKYSFDLSSAFDAGLDWIDACIDINENLVIHADCRLGKNQSIPFAPQQIIFQSFRLPENNINQDEVAGKELYGRGFLSPGSMIGSDFSFLCICDYCEKSFRLQNQHLAMSPLVHMYCESGYHTLLAEPAKSFNFKNNETWLEFESLLPKCNLCNTSFRMMNPFRCPNCHEPFINYEKYPEQRVHDINAVNLYSQAYQYWLPKNNK
jgi:hypothetical protein